MFKQALLATVLIAVPAAIFTAGEVLLAPPAQSEQSLGDLSALTAIAADVQKIAATGDLAAAEKRITDFETEWDKNQDTMRPLNPEPGEPSMTLQMRPFIPCARPIRRSLPLTAP